MIILFKMEAKRKQLERKWLNWYQADIIVKDAAILILVLYFVTFVATKSFLILIPFSIQILLIIITSSFVKRYEIKLEEIK